MTASKKALAADFLAVALLAAGTLALFTHDLSFRIVGVRISMRTAWRPFLLARHRPGHPELARAGGRPVLPGSSSPSGGSRFARLVKEAEEPLPLDERALVRARPTCRASSRCCVLGFSALVIALTWPQIRRLDSVADLGDPLFSVWRIAWVSHQLPRNPLALFDANQFYPERLTLTYSDSLHRARADERPVLLDRASIPS